MKKLFSIALVAIFAFAMNAKAQNQLIATLNHEGAVTVFYGADAFANAHGAATHGDVITLSPGKFKSTNITKAITIQGAGITTKIDSVSQIEPTTIQGNFSINIADSITQQLKMEGIYHQDDNHIGIDNLKNPQFIRCRFFYIAYSGRDIFYENFTFVNCRIAGSLFTNNHTVKVTATFSNCVVNSVRSNDPISCCFVNCYLTEDASKCESSEYRNCVIYHRSGGQISSSSSKYYNNLLVSSYDVSLNNYNNTNNIKIMGNVAPNLAIKYSDANTYELTEEQKAMIKGTDGTEVGIYGGLFPYDPVPNIPQITKFKVANKSTADGKLKVEVEVKGAE